MDFVEAARHVFEHSNFDFLLQTIDYARTRERHAIGSLLSQRVQAIFLPSIGHTTKIRDLLETLPIPLIEVGNLPEIQSISLSVIRTSMLDISRPDASSRPAVGKSRSSAATSATPRMRGTV